MKEILKLDNQLCFALYTASRKMTQMYKPMLSPLGLTYPQYLVMLVLLEHEELTVKALGEKLYLDSGTLTPLLKRMEKNGFVQRKRSETDERKVYVTLTEVGRALETQLESVPVGLCYGQEVDLQEIRQLRDELKELKHNMSCQEHP